MHELGHNPPLAIELPGTRKPLGGVTAVLHASLLLVTRSEASPNTGSMRQLGMSHSRNKRGGLSWSRKQVQNSTINNITICYWHN